MGVTFSSKKSVMPDVGKVLGLTCCIGGIIALIVVLAMTWKTCEENEVCLRYNVNTREVDPTVVENGIHALGPEWDFLRFPSTYMYLMFIEGNITSEEEGTPEDLTSLGGLQVRSKEGLRMSLQLR